MLEFSYPKSPSLSLQRNELLQRSLRPERTDYPIEIEYPIVLSSLYSEYSICAIRDGDVIAHANLWPRSLVNVHSRETYKVGLVGNVATLKEYRGQGIMTQLINEIIDRSKTIKISALFLWSDLIQFYQSFGFSSFSKEDRFVFTKTSLANFSDLLGNFFLETNNSLTDEELALLLELRPQSGFTLQRGINEFRSLLKIPDTNMLSIRVDGNIVAYAVLGKGYDMNGIVHEWGAVDYSYLFLLLFNIMNKALVQEITLLAPENLSEELSSIFSRHCLEKSTHPMAFCCPLVERMTPGLEKALQDTFIWGLDSI
ncbi:MAG: GNAT family N-acetyltransferase [Bdellovibrionota bacterium]